jgi:hypothetical protein
VKRARTAGEGGGVAGGGRRRVVGAAAVLLAALALVVALLLTRGAEPAPALRTDVPTVRRLLTERLRDKRLTFRYVVCVRSPARYRGGAVARCNVNFNAPHIAVYCGVVRDGALVTDHEDQAVPCPRDDRGVDPPMHVDGG